MFRCASQLAACAGSLEISNGSALTPATAKSVRATFSTSVFSSSVRSARVRFGNRAEASFTRDESEADAVPAASTARSGTANNTTIRTSLAIKRPPQAKFAPTSQSARFITRRHRRAYLRADPARRVQSACGYPGRLCSHPAYGVAPRLADFLQKAPEFWRWRETHGSIRIQEGEPPSSGAISRS